MSLEPKSKLSLPKQWVGASASAYVRARVRKLSMDSRKGSKRSLPAVHLLPFFDETERSI